MSFSARDPVNLGDTDQQHYWLIAESDSMNVIRWTNVGNLLGCWISQHQLNGTQQQMINSCF